MLKWIKTITGLATSVGTALVPFVGPAMKFGPYIAAGVLFGLLMIEHAELGESRAQTALEAGRVAQAVQQCQAEASQQAAQESAASVAQIKAAQAAADAATASLVAARQQAAQAQQQAVQDIATATARIDAQAAQTGQDGAVPPVLGGLFQ